MTDPRLTFLDRLEAATEKRKLEISRVAADVEQLRGTATSADRLVTVQVSPEGALLDLALHDDATDLDARDLAALIVATTHAAAAQVGAQLAQRAEELSAPLLPVDPAEPAEPAGAIGRVDRAVVAAEDYVSRLERNSRTRL